MFGLLTLNRSYQSNRILGITIFFLFLTINLISNGGHFDSWDGVETFLVTESMVIKNTAKLDPTVPSIEKIPFDIKTSISTHRAIQEKAATSDDQIEPIYIARSLFLSAIAVPFYLVSIWFSLPTIPFVALFVNSIILSLTSVIIFYFSFELFKSKKISFCLSLIFGISSFAWPYATSLFPQPLQALTILAAVFFIFKTTTDKDEGMVNAGLAGLFLGLSVLAHPSSIIMVPAILIYGILINKHKMKNILFFVIILFLIFIFIASMNYLRFGSITDFGYGIYSSLELHGGWKGLVGLLVSPGVGILFFFPVAILIPFALKNLYSKNKRLAFLFLYMIIITWVYYGTLSYSEPSAWSGAGGWGPRYLIAILPIISVALGSVLELKNIFFKISIIVFAAIGFVVNLLGILVWYMYGYSYGWGVEGLWQEENSLEVMTWVPNYSPIILHAKVLASDYLTIIPKNIGDYHSIGLHPCPLDIYLFCQWGILPIIILLSIIFILSIFIIKNISKNLSVPYSDNKTTYKK